MRDNEQSVYSIIRAIYMMHIDGRIQEGEKTGALSAIHRNHPEVFHTAQARVKSELGVE